VAQPGWTGAGGTADAGWNRVQLGPSVVPGICTITGLSVGQDIDVKKQKGNDGAVLEDNGLEPAKFNIEVQLNEQLWPAFQEVLPSIDPRRPGASRSPLEIVHPATALANVREIVIRKISIGVPTARGGLKVVFECLQWFPAPKPKKTSTKPKAASTSSFALDDPGQRAQFLAYQSNAAAAEAERGNANEMSRRDMDDNTFGDPFAPIGT
jgi:hypothetical protein